MAFDIYTALITPMKNGKIDYSSLDRIIDHQLNNDITNLVALGSTAECHLLTSLEKYKVLGAIRKRTDGQCHLMVGTGNCNTATAVRDAQKAYDYGADSLLVVTPYYVGYTTSGIIEHYRQIHDSTPLPIVLYNVPSRTGHSISAELAVHLHQLGYISAIKECTADLTLSKAIARRDKTLPIYCGNDNLIKQYHNNHMQGCISVLSNIAPVLVAKSITSRRHNKAVGALSCAMSQYPNPVAIKQLALYRGLIDSNFVRLPLTSSASSDTKLQKAVEKYSKLL